MVVESRNAENSGDVDSCFVSAELGDECAVRSFGELGVEIDYSPDDLPFVGRSVDDHMRGR